jgi:hypothetical protein
MSSEMMAERRSAPVSFARSISRAGVLIAAQISVPKPFSLSTHKEGLLTSRRSHERFLLLLLLLLLILLILLLPTSSAGQNADPPSLDRSDRRGASFGCLAWCHGSRP